MYNYFMLIGRAKSVTTQEVNGNKLVILKLSVSDEFRSENGELAIRDHDIEFWQFMGEYVLENASKGDLVAIKGRIAQRELTLEGGNKIVVPMLIGERAMITKKEKEEE